LAFFLASLVPALIAPGMTIWVGAIGALAATVTEALSGSIDDNLSVPLVSGLIMHLLLKVSV
jgi:dolichol kinase